MAEKVKIVCLFQIPHTNGLRTLEVSDLTELSTSAIPAGIECNAAAAAVDSVAAVTAGTDNGCVTSIEVNGDSCDQSDIIGDVHDSIIDLEGFNLEDFIVYVRNKTRNGLFDEYQEIKSNPPDGTFDHARMAENLVKVNIFAHLCPNIIAKLCPNIIVQPCPNIIVKLQVRS